MKWHIVVDDPIVRLALVVVLGLTIAVAVAACMVGRVAEEPPLDIGAAETRSDWWSSKRTPLPDPSSCETRPPVKRGS